MTSNSDMNRIAVDGDLSIYTARAVREQLLAALDAGAEVEVDLSRIGEIDSAGVQLLLAAKREAAARGKPLRFAGHSAAVLDILDLCGLGGHCDAPAPAASAA